MLSSRHLHAAGGATLALFAFAQPVNAATVMDFPDNAALKGKVELEAYNFRSAPPIARQCAGTGGSGTFTITKPVDAMSPQIAEASKTKKGVMLQIDDTKADGTHVAYQLTNAIANSIKPASAGDKPMEQVSFNYANIQWITVSPCKVTVQPRRNNNAAGAPGGGGYGGGYGGGGGRY